MFLIQGKMKSDVDTPTFEVCTGTVESLFVVAKLLEESKDIVVFKVMYLDTSIEPRDVGLRHFDKWITGSLFKRS